MMTIEQIRELQQIRDGVCVTLLLPLYTTSPEDQQQTPIRLKTFPTKPRNNSKASMKPSAKTF